MYRDSDSDTPISAWITHTSSGHEIHMTNVNSKLGDVVVFPLRLSDGESQRLLSDFYQMLRGQMILRLGLFPAPKRPTFLERLRWLFFG